MPRRLTARMASDAGSGVMNVSENCLVITDKFSPVPPTRAMFSNTSKLVRLAKLAAPFNVPDADGG